VSAKCTCTHSQKQWVLD